MQIERDDFATYIGKTGRRNIMRERATKRLVIAGVLAGIIILLTVFASIPMPVSGGHGYIHLGDAAVLVAAYVLGGGWAALCAGVASALSDVLLGWSVYAPASFLIKGCVAFLAGSILSRSQKKGRSFIVYPAALIVPFGYYLYETMLYDISIAILNLPLNTLQSLVGAALAQGLVIAMTKRGVLNSLFQRASVERVRMLRDPKNGPDVVLVASDERLVMRAADILSVQGITARVLLCDHTAKRILTELVPGNTVLIRHDEQMSAEDYARQAVEAYRHDL